MEKKIKYPRVLIVGRTNVGKSTIFNRLVSKKRSIVFDKEGVTRDYVQELVTWDSVPFNLVDTGGLCIRQHEVSDIEKKIQEKIMPLLATADLLLFVCDIKNGLTKDDAHIAKLLHKTNVPTVLLLNKADNKMVVDDNMHDFYSLGFKDIIPVSAVHGTGVGDLLNYIVHKIPAPKAETPVKPAHKIVILGKPNVGKSSLMNLLTNQERSIVSPIPGTTREAITENIYFCSEFMQITDTAGVRKQSKINDDLESLMIKSSLASIREADAVLMMVDASAGKISDQELKLLFYALENKKPTVILYNKVDLINDYTKILLEQCLDEYDFVLKKTTQLSISCLTKKNICKVLAHVQKVLARCKQIFDAGAVDELIKQQIEKKPMYHKTLLLKIHKVRNVPGTIPTFTLKVNYPEFFGPTQLGFVENVLRKNYDLLGCPVDLIVLKHKNAN